MLHHFCLQNLSAFISSLWTYFCILYYGYCLGSPFFMHLQGLRFSYKMRIYCSSLYFVSTIILQVITKWTAVHIAKNINNPIPSFPPISLYPDYSYLTIGNKKTIRYAHNQLTIVVKGIVGGWTISGIYR